LEGKSEWALRAGRRQKLTLLLLPTPIRHCCVHSNGQDFDSFHDIGNGTQIGGVTRASSSSKAFASKTFQAFHLYTEEDGMNRGRQIELIGERDVMREPRLK
jgi:hypothetical protein